MPTTTKMPAATRRRAFRRHRIGRRGREQLVHVAEQSSQDLSGDGAVHRRVGAVAQRPPGVDVAFLTSQTAQVAFFSRSQLLTNGAICHKRAQSALIRQSVLFAKKLRKT